MARDDITRRGATRRDVSPDAPTRDWSSGDDAAAAESHDHDRHITRISVVEVPQTERDPEAADRARKHAGAHRLDIGTLVRERYELTSVLGEGGMGTVYRALDHLHEEMHDRDPYVAIKILSEEFKRHPNALIALQRETRKAQTLAHENIISVYNFDRDGSTVYMTMELLDGTTLRKIVSENESGLAPRDVVPMIRGMAKALAYAHANDIVHSDFKPSNVFLTSKRQIKVLDFGVARASPLKTQVDGDTALDVHEVGGMTPAYASPQMLAGNPPTPSDDVFALAVVAYELLSGEHPLGGAPAHEAALRRLKPRGLAGLSRPQRRALLRALAPDREARHAHAGEFLKEFERAGLLKRASVGVGAAAALPTAALIISMQGGELSPAVPFEELPVEIQQRFDDAIAEGRTALGFGEAGFNDALVYFSQAFDLHPNNERAVSGLEDVADGFLQSIGGADVATQREVFELLYCQSHLNGYAPLTRVCANSLGAEACAAISARCRAAEPD